MTIGKLLIYVGIVAILITAGIAFSKKEQKNMVLSFLQNFCGVLFLVSGFVKAVDPLGTAFKMEDYFAEFQATFEATWFSFIAPLFPLLSDLSSGFSVFMIVFELVLGLALILGAKPKWTAWAFLLLVVFFTILTGFTYLTGYVPSGANFFEFSNWTAYDANNMKVTDCGCFGDFIKLEPKTSFLKDVVLLLPALLFVFRSKDFHQLLSAPLRHIIIGLFTVISLVYCFNNYVWDIPGLDFRPFAEGVDVRSQIAKEEEAQINREIIGWVFENPETGEEKSVMNPDFKAAKAELPQGDWETMDQVQTEPAIPLTKISDFMISGEDGYEVTEEILQEEGYSFMIVSYKMYLQSTSTESIAVTDSLYRRDTIQVADSLQIVQSLDTIITRQEERYNFEWAPQYVQHYNKLVPFLEAAVADGHQVYGITKSASPEQLADLKKETGFQFPIYTADDILLKTIIRSNPGIVLWKDGKIIEKWHHNKLPEYEQVKNKNLK